MARHLLQRFLLTLSALRLALTLVFLMIHIVPGDPVEQMLGEGAAPGGITQLRHALNLDEPLLTQYGHYLNVAISANPSDSRRPLAASSSSAILPRSSLPLVCAAFAIPAGVIAAYRRGHTADRAVGRCARSE
jgi:ABC-type dipeptide/oligopeptide/nickel transport system permease component